MENEFTCEECHGPVNPDMLICDKCYMDKGGNKYHCLTCKDFIFEDDGGGDLPDWCYFYCHNCHTIEELLEDYSADQRDALRKYANKYDMSILRAIEYQTCCHCCGKTVEDAEFHESEHQYCRQCDHLNYPCFRGNNCLVCGSLYEKNRRAELKRSAPVLAAISAFKEKKVYAQFFECLPDLVEYFG